MKHFPFYSDHANFPDQKVKDVSFYLVLYLCAGLSLQMLLSSHLVCDRLLGVRKGFSLHLLLVDELLLAPELLQLACVLLAKVRAAAHRPSLGFRV